MSHTLKERLAAYEQEKTELEKSHIEMVESFKEQVTRNQTRFAQITGAIAELKELTKLYEHINHSNGSGPGVDPLTGHVFGATGGIGGDLGTPVGDREL